MEAASIATNVIDNLLGLLTEEAASFREATIFPEIDLLRQELGNLRASIERVKLLESGAPAWLGEATRIALRVDAVLGMYLLQTAQRRHVSGFNNLVRQTNDFIRNIKPGHVIFASEIREVVAGLREMKKRGEQKGLFCEKGSSCTFFHEDGVVGLESEKEELVNLLVGEQPPERLVISLVGLGGVGKTTLASVVFRSEEVKKQFDFQAWTNVSESDNFENLLRQATKKICPEGEMDSIADVISRLNEYLMAKRYVMVFDGVWQADFLQLVDDVLPDNNKGSRIIITTRDNAIAASCDVVQKIKPFSEEKAWKLFSELAFRCEFKGECPPELKDLSLEIVRRCNGLPLLIWAIADILSTKRKILFEWQMILDNIINEIGENQNPSLIEEVSRIFYQNYGDLPCRIRLCLLYFAIFPKDYLISDLKLIKLWIAQGFVKEETGKTMEQVAEAYLNELINRNLVQVSNVNYYDNERMCRVHGFMHEIVSSRAKMLKLCQVLDENSSMSLEESNIRFLSIYGDAINALEISAEHPNVHFLFLFNGNKMIVKNSSVLNLLERFKLLELLDLENAQLDDLPNEVGNLFLLKYLSLRNTKVKTLPKSLGLLLNLQTLDVRNTLIRQVPIQIQRLRKLRHLLASAHNDKRSLDSIHGVKVEEGIAYLEDLQTLMTIEAHDNSSGVIRELEKLRQLRCLNISKLTADMVDTICSVIEKMIHLESLSLYFSNDSETFDLEFIASPPPSLRRLVIKGGLEKFPDWILRLQNLSILGLSFSRLAVDPLNSLQFLPNLKFLWLHGAYNGEQLHFNAVSFQKLKQLVLTELYDLRTIEIERGALPLLEELRIGCNQNDLSFDIQHLRNLQTLECYDMSDEFVLRLQPEGGSDYWKVKHVPSVIFRYRIHGNRYVSYKLGEPGLLDHVKGLVRTKNVELYCRQLSFFYNDDEELARTSNADWSDQHSFVTDDIED